jgi:hypothetical protein
MSKTIGQFTYHIVKMGKNEKLPFNPIATIRLDHYSSSQDEMPTVSPHLMTEEEINHHIQALKDDLDAVGKKAKAALRKAIDEARSYKSNRATTK